MVDTAVFLPCEHWATVSHVSGDRMTTCPQCGEETVVRAESVNVIRYLMLDEEYDDTGRLIRSEWRTIADIQAEIEARQNVEAKQHAIEDGLATQEEMFPPIEDESNEEAFGGSVWTDIPIVEELDCPEYQSLEPSHEPEYCVDIHPGMTHVQWITNVPYKVGDVPNPNPRVGDVPNPNPRVGDQLESD